MNTICQIYRDKTWTHCRWPSQCRCCSDDVTSPVDVPFPSVVLHLSYVVCLLSRAAFALGPHAEDAHAQVASVPLLRLSA